MFNSGDSEPSNPVYCLALNGSIWLAEASLVAIEDFNEVITIIALVDKRDSNTFAPNDRIEWKSTLLVCFQVLVESCNF